MPRPRPQDWRYGTVAVIVGGGVMTVEMTASRLLAPFFGASFFVWTAIIVTVLVAMAMGYWFGGRLASRQADDATLSRLLLAGAAFMAIGLLALPQLAVPLRRLFGGAAFGSSAVFLGSLTVCTLIFALPVFLLAAAGPLLVKLWGHHDDLGLATGRYFAVSTVGSVIGTLAPALVLVPLVGSRLTFAGTALLFAVTGLVLSPWVNRRRAALWSAFAMLCVVVTTPTAGAGTLLLKETTYELVRITEDARGWRYLSYNEGMGVQSVLPADHRALTGLYFDYPEIGPRLHEGTWDDYRVAVVGVAGGSSFWAMSRGVPEGAKWSAVGAELNPVIAEAGPKYFGLGELPVTTVVGDGRVFLETTPERFDLVFIDAYSQQLYIPSHLVTREFFAATHRRLKPGGLLMMNVNATDRSSPILTTMLNTIAADYPWVALLRVENSWNWIILAADAPKDLLKLSTDERLPLAVRSSLEKAETVTAAQGARVFTDDWAPVDFMTDAMVLKTALTER
jgi:spermidine synthase